MLASASRFSPRLELRPFRRRDLDGLVEAAADSIADLNKWLPWAHAAYGRRDALIFLRDSVSAWGEGRAFDFAVRYLENPGYHVGNVSVWFVSRQSRVGEVGYWIRSSETRKGVATEAAARILEVAFEELDLHRVVLRIAVGNHGSERVAEKLGFTREGLLREELQVNGEWMDHSVWGLLEKEYRAMKTQYANAGWVMPA
ncbi:MAG: GNAT family N-acetyltransferase [Acidimicrobiia bacterium]|nr:GNAT family N-acetyltransferase [Acidimicrobiia bacterium]